MISDDHRSTKPGFSFQDIYQTNLNKPLKVADSTKLPSVKKAIKRKSRFPSKHRKNSTELEQDQNDSQKDGLATPNIQNQELESSPSPEPNQNNTNQNSILQD